MARDANEAVDLTGVISRNDVDMVLSAMDMNDPFDFRRRAERGYGSERNGGASDSVGDTGEPPVVERTLLRRR